jgi:hypothetical protein
MLEAIILAALQYALPSIITAVAAHQKATGTVPTPAQVTAAVPELAILAQGAAWRAANPLALPIAPAA